MGTRNQIPGSFLGTKKKDSHFTIHAKLWWFLCSWGHLHTLSPNCAWLWSSWTVPLKVGWMLGTGFDCLVEEKWHTVQCLNRRHNLTLYPSYILRSLTAWMLSLFVLCKLMKGSTSDTPCLDLPHASFNTASGLLRCVFCATTLRWCFGRFKGPFTTFSSVLAVNTTKSTSSRDVIFGSQQECKRSHVVGCVC